MSSQAPNPPVLPEQFGPYRIVRPLGKGGMGAVYLARDTRLNRDVALKVCTLSADPQASERFRREAKAAASLRHPNLCPVHEFDVRGDIAYLTMAYIDGPTLDRWREGRPLSQRRAAMLVCKLALAMHTAHTGGIVHRDLKPANVAMDNNGEPVILDFGLARHLDAGRTRMTEYGAVYGTLSYMAPEQAGGDPATIGPACDIYSLGVILYELLTGVVPFQGTPVAVLAQLVHATPEPPRRRNPAVTETLEAICLKTLAKKPGDRFSSMKAFAKALQEAASTAASSGATPVSAPVRATEAVPTWLPQGTEETMPPPLPTFSTQSLPTSKRGKSRRLGRAGWIMLALLLLSLGTAGAWLFTRHLQPSGGPGPDIRYVPEDCQFIATLNVDEVFNSRDYQQLKRDIPDIEKKFEHQIEGEIGLSLINIERILVAGSVWDRQPLVVIRTKNPINASDIRSTMTGSKYQRNVEWNESKAGRFTIHEKTCQFDWGGDGKLAERKTVMVFSVPESNVVMFGDASNLRRVLERDKKPEFSVRMQQILNTLDFSQTMAMAVDIKAICADPKVRRDLSSERNFSRFVDLLDSLDGCAMNADLKSSQVKIKSILVCKDAKIAEEIKTILAGAVLVIKRFLESQQEVPLELDVTDQIDSIKLSVTSSKVIATADAKLDPLIKLVKGEKRRDDERRRLWDEDERRRRENLNEGKKPDEKAPDGVEKDRQEKK